MVHILAHSGLVGVSILAGQGQCPFSPSKVNFVQKTVKDGAKLLFPKTSEDFESASIEEGVASALQPLADA